MSHILVAFSVFVRRANQLAVNKYLINVHSNHDDSSEYYYFNIKCFYAYYTEKAKQHEKDLNCHEQTNAADNCYSSVNCNFSIIETCSVRVC